MSLQSQLQALIVGIASDIKSLQGTDITLAAQANGGSSAFASIYTRLSALETLTSSLATINDAGVIGDTTHVYSINKVLSLIATAKSELQSDQSAAIATLNALSTQLAGDETTIAGLLTQIGHKVDFSVAQTLTGPEAQQARDNIGAASAGAVATNTSDIAALTTTVGNNLTAVNGSISALAATESGHNTTTNGRIDTLTSSTSSSIGTLTTDLGTLTGIVSALNTSTNTSFSTLNTNLGDVTVDLAAAYTTAKA